MLPPDGLKGLQLGARLASVPVGSRHARKQAQLRDHRAAWQARQPLCTAPLPSLVPRNLESCPFHQACPSTWRAASRGAACQQLALTALLCPSPARGAVVGAVPPLPLPLFIWLTPWRTGLLPKLSSLCRLRRGGPSRRQRPQGHRGDGRPPENSARWLFRPTCVHLSWPSSKAVMSGWPAVQAMRLPLLPATRFRWGTPHWRQLWQRASRQQTRTCCAAAGACCQRCGCVR